MGRAMTNVLSRPRIEGDTKVKRLLAERPFGSLEPAGNFCGWHFGFG
jgi:hypothetical protein